MKLLNDIDFILLSKSGISAVCEISLSSQCGVFARSIPPGTAGRPKTGQRPIGTAMGGRQPGTATRLTTAMNPGTARPGTRGGPAAAGGALDSRVTVVDRPMTQQGLGGMKTAAKGQRQVHDRTYYLGLVRSKINELNTETARLNKEIENVSEENSSYLTYEKRAETLAGEIKDLQGELGDYNTLVDKLTTDEDIQDVEFDLNDLKAANEREARKIEDLFELKKQKEDQIRQIEHELDQEKRMADNLVNDMNPDMRQKYYRIKDMNEHMLKQLEDGQEQLDVLNSKMEGLQEELSMSQVKQEAVRLYEQLNELEMKRDSLIEEAKSTTSPAEEREKLLKQVKEDNVEIASMERQSNEFREKMESVQEEIHSLDMDIEENQGERNQKYKELKKREETMDDFLHTFEDAKAQEYQKISELEQNVVSLLEHISRNMGRFTALPSQGELAEMKEDLAFKEGEMKKSEFTSMGLAQEHEKLHEDLEKVEQLEDKINTELVMLREKIANMETELHTFRDLDSLKKKSEEKKQKLQSDRIILQKRKETFKRQLQQLSSKYEGLKATLNDNETYTQLGNLERKWQHHEQNNFVMRDFYEEMEDEIHKKYQQRKLKCFFAPRQHIINAKTMECNYRPISRRVFNGVNEYNSLLQTQMANNPSM